MVAKLFLVLLPIALVLAGECKKPKKPIYKKWDQNNDCLPPSIECETEAADLAARSKYFVCFAHLPFFSTTVPHHVEAQRCRLQCRRL